jgi:hypothetical protein
MLVAKSRLKIADETVFVLEAISGRARVTSAPVLAIAA